MSTRSPSHEFMQSIGLTRLICGGSRRALNGSLKEFSSVTNVMTSSKSEKLGAWNVTANVRLIPGATSPVSPEGYLILLIVNISVAGGMNLIRLETLALFVTLTEISYTPLSWQSAKLTVVGSTLNEVNFYIFSTSLLSLAAYINESSKQLRVVFKTVTIKQQQSICVFEYLNLLWSSRLELC